MDIKCTLKKDNEEYLLNNNQENQEVPENRYSLLLTELPEDKNLMLKINDNYYDTLKTSAYSTLVDLINNVGYHKIEILDETNNIVFKTSFFTGTYKLSEKAFNRMLNFVANNSLWKGRQFVYYDKNNIMHKIIDPLFLFNWIDKHFDMIEGLILKIDQNPNKDTLIHYKKSFINSNKYNKKKTISYLQNNPHLFFEDNNGIVHINNKRFNPQATIKEKTIHNIKINEHLQILEFLLKIYHFLINFDKNFSNIRYKEIRQDCKNKMEQSKWLQRIYNLRNNTFLKDISVLDTKYIERFPMSKLQYSNSYYGELYRLYINYLTNYYDFINEYNENFYQHVKNIDKIYESFCCYILADILNLSPVNKDFLVSGKAFRNNNFELYYQSKPSTLKGWALSDTPDIILKYKDGKVLILDSKFKINKGSVKGEDIQKLQAYLNNYFQNIGLILYPGKEIGYIKDKVNYLYKIYQIPILPWKQRTYKRMKNKIRNEIYNIFMETRGDIYASS